MSGTLGVFLETEIYPFLDRAQVLSDLEPKDKGNHYELRCPGCGEREAYIYKDKYRMACNRLNNCNYSSTIISYVAGTPGVTPTGSTFVDAVKALAKLINKTIPERELTAEQIEKLQASLKRESDLEHVIGLSQAGGLPAQCLEYLSGRGFSAPPAEFGWSNQQFILALSNVPSLIGADADFPEITSKKLALWQDRFIIPLRDHRGHLQGFCGRTLNPEVEPKYLYSHNADLKGLGAIGLDKALAKGNHTIELVEGVLDVFLIRCHGNNKAAAIGGSFRALTADRWTALVQRGVRCVTLITDNDKAGHEGLVSALDNAAKLDRVPEIFVVDPTEMGATKDPDGLIRERGYEAYQELLTNRVNSFTYRARLFAEGKDLSKEYDRQQFIEAATAFDEGIRDPKRTFQLSETFWPEVNRLLPNGIDLDTFQDYRDLRRTTAAETAQQIELSSMLTKLQTAVNEKNVAKARQIMSDGLEQVLRLDVREPVIKPALSVYDELEDHLFEMSKYAGRTIMGLQQHAIPTWDSSLSGLQGNGLIIARPNVGKTVLFCQTAYNVLINNPDTCCIFLSREMRRGAIFRRLFAHIAEMPFNQMLFGSGREPGFPFTPAEEKIRERTVEVIRSFTRRIKILDDAVFKEPTAQRILQKIVELKEETETSNCLVLIDSIDTLELPAHKEHAMGGQERQVEKEQVKTVKLLSDALEEGKNAVISISEVRKSESRGKLIHNSPVHMEDASGTNQKGHRADWVMSMNPLTDIQLLQNYMPGGSLRYRRDGESDVEEGDTLSKANMKEAKKIREALEEKGIAPGMFEIEKVRDGGRRAKWFYTHFFLRSKIVEGLNGNA